LAVGHYENFPVASRLVPAHLRGAVVAVYRFARGADDIADEGDAPPAERLALLARWHRQLDAIERGEPVGEPPFAALARAIAAHALPLAPFHALLDAFEQDVTTTRYASFDALADYCRRSANPVGRLMLHLYGAATPANVAASDAVCTGLQLANFWQDVAIDWRKGRVYLPQDDLARFGVTEAAIAQGRCDAAWQALLAFEVARTRGLLLRGRALPPALSWRLGLEIAAVIEGGLRICERIEKVGYDVFRRRPVLRAADWLRIGTRALHARGVRLRRAGVPSGT
jgi:phytoene synthase